MYVSMSVCVWVCVRASVMSAYVFVCVSARLCVPQCVRVCVPGCLPVCDGVCVCECDWVCASPFARESAFMCAGVFVLLALVGAFVERVCVCVLSAFVGACACFCA